jgi:hypothetical protein
VSKLSSRVSCLEAFLELEVMESDTPGVGLLQRIATMEQHIFGEAQQASSSLPGRLEALEAALGVEEEEERQEVQIRIQPEPQSPGGAVPFGMQSRAFAQQGRPAR